MLRAWTSSPQAAPGSQPPRDEVDDLVAAWRAERPDLDVAPLQVLSRVSRLARHLDRARRAAFAAHGLETWEFDVLSALRRQGPPYQLSPGALLRATLVTSGTMTNRIDRLADAGLVRREPDPQDKRGVLVTLTAAGRAAVDAALADLLRSERALLTGLDRGQQRELAACCGSCSRRSTPTRRRKAPADLGPPGSPPAADTGRASYTRHAVQTLCRRPGARRATFIGLVMTRWWPPDVVGGRGPVGGPGRAEDQLLPRPRRLAVARASSPTRPAPACRPGRGTPTSSTPMLRRRDPGLRLVELGCPGRPPHDDPRRRSAATGAGRSWPPRSGSCAPTAARSR